MNTRKCMEHMLGVSCGIYASLQEDIKRMVANEMWTDNFERNMMSTLTNMIQVRQEITAYQRALEIRE